MTEPNYPPVQMVIECADKYRFDEQPDGSVHITIDAPARFGALWAVKLSELYASAEEIAEWEPE